MYFITQIFSFTKWCVILSYFFVDLMFSLTDDSGSEYEEESSESEESESEEIEIDQKSNRFAYNYNSLSDAEYDDAFVIKPLYTATLIIVMFNIPVMYM